jgi:hypothetical protein
MVSPGPREAVVPLLLVLEEEEVEALWDCLVPCV